MVTGPVVQAARMRERKKRGPGRPSHGVKEKSITFWAPNELAEDMARAAEKQGISAAEAWRRAAAKWLGDGPHPYTKYLEAKVDE